MQAHSAVDLEQPCCKCLQVALGLGRNNWKQEVNCI